MARPAERLEDDRQEGGLLDNDLGIQPRSSRVGQGASEHGENIRVSPVQQGIHTSSGPGGSGPTPSEKHSLKDGKAIDPQSALTKKAAGKALDHTPGMVSKAEQAEQGSLEKAGRKAASKVAKKAAQAAATDSGVGAPLAKAAGDIAEEAVKRIDVKGGAKKSVKVVAIAAFGFIVVAMLPLLMFTYIVTQPWKAVQQVLKDSSFTNFALSARKLAIGDGNNQTLMAIAGSMPYEADYKPGSAIAATAGQRPEPGTLLDVISKVDYEKSRNLFKNVSCPYKVKTKQVVASDGAQRAVIDKVVDAKGDTADIADADVFDCILEQYPVFEAMMRSPEARKINKQMKINLSYAEKKDSEAIKDKPKEEVKRVLHKKTTDRVWRNAKDTKGLLYPDSCQEDFKPTGDKANKAILEVANDLLCGDLAENIQINYPVEDLDDDFSKQTVKQRIDEADVICVFYDKLNADPEAAKKQRYDRALSSARAGISALTLADTGVVPGDISVEELDNDFYKISNFASSRAYNQEINGTRNGVQMDPEAIPTRAIGLTKAYFDSLSDPNRPGGQLLNLGEQCKKFKANKPTTLTQNVRDIQSLAAIAKGQIARENQDFYGGTSANLVSTNDLIIRTIRLVSNISNSGAEGGENNFNRMTVGAKNTMYNYTISLLGGSYQTDAQANEDSIAVGVMKKNRDKQSSMLARIFDTKNPRSLASRIAAGSTATPKQITENTTRYAVNILNPIKALADINAGIAFIGYGETNIALAARSDDMEYWKIDTTGTTTNLDTLKNAAYIERLKKSGANTELFASFDKCMETYFPDKQAVDEAKDENCMIMRETDEGRRLGAANPAKRSLARSYATYKGNMNFYTAWAKLSSDEQDDSIYAKGENSSGFGVGGAVGADPDGPQSDPGADTSGTDCPQEPGITTAPEDTKNGVDAKGVVQTYGPGRVPKNKIKLCVVQGIRVNVSVASNLNKMVSAAGTSGLALSGSGWRSYDRQKELRISNGCPADDNAPSSSCRVPTARPGSSNHEQGEAVDFNNSRTRGTAVYAWLKSNASKYGFFNFPREAWHWSRNGK